MPINYFDPRTLIVIENDEDVILGIEDLAKVLRDKLNRIKNKEDLGLFHDDGKPVNSLRGLAKYMNYEKGYSYLSKFANDDVMPCITTLNKIANTFEINYVVGNFVDD